MVTMKLKLKLFRGDAKRRESFWLHPVDLYLVCLNWNFFVVVFFMKLAAMRQPVTPTETIQFINSTIKSAGLQSTVNDWKEKHAILVLKMMVNLSGKSIGLVF
jgi:hypothetical protein